MNNPRWISCKVQKPKASDYPMITRPHPTDPTAKTLVQYFRVPPATPFQFNYHWEWISTGDLFSIIQPSLNEKETDFRAYTEYLRSNSGPGHKCSFDDWVAACEYARKKNL